jgi:glycosyltransferase involved in cell wall biosynthesis
MRRVLILTMFPERLGGSDNVLLTFLTHLDRTEFEPVVAVFGEGAFVRELEALGVRTAVLPPGRLRDPRHMIRSVRMLRDVLRAEDPALILNWLSTAQIYGGLSAVLARMSSRVVWWQHDLNVRRMTRGGALDQLANLIPAAAIGACSRAAARAQARLRPRRRIIPVHPGIDGDESAVPDSDGAGSIAIPGGRFVVGTIGRLFAWKGHHHVLEAVGILAREGHDVHALIVGGGGHRGDSRYERSLRELVAAAGLEDRVSFTGQVPDARSYLVHFDAFVNASAAEPFGLVLLEAMDAGVPVVAVDAAGPAEIIESGSTGLLVPSAEARDLAAGLAALMSSDELRSRLVRDARARREAYFSGERMTREMEDLLKELSDA